LHLAPLH